MSKLHRMKLFSLIKICSIIRYKWGSRTAATSKMERFAIIVNGFQPLTIITKRSILDVAAVLDPPLRKIVILSFLYFKAIDVKHLQTCKFKNIHCTKTKFSIKDFLGFLGLRTGNFQGIVFI